MPTYKRSFQDAAYALGSAGAYAALSTETTTSNAINLESSGYDGVHIAPELDWYKLGGDPTIVKIEWQSSTDGTNWDDIAFDADQLDYSITAEANDPCQKSYYFTGYAYIRALITNAEYATKPHGIKIPYCTWNYVTA